MQCRLWMAAAATQQLAAAEQGHAEKTQAAADKAAELASRSPQACTAFAGAEEMQAVAD